MLELLIFVKQQLFRYLPLTLCFLAVACDRNSPPQDQDKSPSPSVTYRHSERQLTPEEEIKSLSQLDQNIEENLNSQIVGALYQDRRTPQEKQELDTYIQSWVSIDPKIAPFLGRRQIINNTYIYPSRTKGQVCLIQQYYSPQTDYGVSFDLGRVENEILKTSADQTIISRNGLLAVITIQENKPNVSLLPHAYPLEESTLENLPGIRKQFEESQCQFTAPS